MVGEDGLFFWILKCPQAFDNVASEASMWFSRLSPRFRPACAKEDTCSGCWPWPLAETEDDSGLKPSKLEIKCPCMTQLVKLARNMTNYSELWAEVSNPAQRPRPLEMWRGSVDTFPNSWVHFGYWIIFSFPYLSEAKSVRSYSVVIYKLEKGIFIQEKLV